MTTSITTQKNGFYTSIRVNHHGGPDQLHFHMEELRLPDPDEVRVRILVTPVCAPDVQARYGQSPLSPALPFTPGYVIVGEVDACGSSIKTIKPGESVAALTITGGYSEVIYLNASQIIPIPQDLEPIKVSALILNYLVAYQCLHRKAKVQPGDSILVIGASGGVGTAFLQLGHIIGLKMYAVASSSKHHILEQYGAIPIDYHELDMFEFIRKHEPLGIDAVFDGMSGSLLSRGFSILGKDGVWVHYGNPENKRNVLKLLLRYITYNLIPNHRSLRLYGTSSKLGKAEDLEDWNKLLDLYRTGQIDPIIYRVYPLSQVKEANQLLESGQVVGNIILEVAP